MEENERILNQYKVLVDFLGHTLGCGYEIVLHDVRTPEAGIVAIANGSVSGRGIGSPMTDKALQMAAQGEYQRSDYLVNYAGRIPNGKLIRSSTMFIKDDDGNLIGMLCVNFDDSQYQDLAKRLSDLIHPKEYSFSESREEPSAVTEFHETGAKDAEQFHNNPDDLIESIFHKATEKYDISLDRLTQDERVEIIRQLKDNGLFQLKGAIPYVAERLFCSTASVYRYIGKIGREGL